ncbi:O-linked N-acetylglucosamine transferase family protein [Variovorax sp. RA8]|uniref:O-linked N-acetylglucosamine transferase family protein n=1 Tax=Variovorax sp. (strain JCM 16519 / RA8) TaxID=662548 RepID=UPI001317FE29|nr:tetratricopeptide repeat protein [Variovorax sp. RA8]VTU15180.1 putative PEP-CTERM system TPR-repeat lipoprotein [Variovorax sp. RA8]
MKFKAFINRLLSGSRSAQDQWVQADLAAANGNPSEALAIYRDLASITPRSADDYCYSGLSQLRLGEPKRGIENLEAGLGKFPEDRRLLEHYVRTCSELGQINRAIQRFTNGTTSKAGACETLFAQVPHSNVQVSLIEYCLNNAMTELADARFQSVQENLSDTTSAWRLADALLQNRRSKEAEVIYRRLAVRPAENSEAVMHSALAEYRLHNPGRAVDLLEKGLADYPAAHNLREHMVRICSELGQMDRVTRVLVPNAANETQACEALFDAYKDPQIQVNLIGYCLRSGLIELAERKIRSAIEDIVDSEALWKLSDLLLQNGRTGDAEAIYRHLTTQQASSPESAMYAGLAAYRLRNPEQAADLLEAGLEKFPKAEQLMGHFARICIEIHKVSRVARFVAPEAKTEADVCEVLFEKFVHSPVQVSLIEYCAKNGLAELAEQKLIFVQQTSRDATTLWNVAELLAKLGRRNEAAEIYKALVARDVESAEDYYYSSLASLRLDDFIKCLETLENGQQRYPADGDMSALYMQVCARRLEYDRYLRFVENSGSMARSSALSMLDFYHWFSKRAPVDFVVNFKELESMLPAGMVDTLRKRFILFLRENPQPMELARILVFFTKYLDLSADFAAEILNTILDSHRADNEQFRADERALRILHDLSPPMIPHYQMDPGWVLRQFIFASQSLAESPIELTNPIVDMTINWMPWQLLFCQAKPELYGEAMAALEKMVFKTWPKLNFVAPHIGRRFAATGEKRNKIRVGFNVHDSMPMMSGLLTQLNPDIFDTVFLRPGKPGQTPAAKSWVERAGKTVEFSDLDTYAAVETIASQELDIIVAGPAIATSFYPMMAKLAPLQMILLEPNWTDGLTNSDYYISWRQAEPEDPAAYYKTAVSFLEHPPYWIEKPALSSNAWPVPPAIRAEVRRRLLNCGPDVRVYLCANTPPKVHPEMDEIFRDLLERDGSGVLVFLRAEYKNLKIRLREKLGKSFERVIFLPALSKDDAHLLLQSVDCCLDSYPLCGMSSSFDGAMLGVPIVTLPSEIPFGRWTAAIYEYIGVTGLTARDKHDYIDIAVKLAKDSAWRNEKATELRQKSSLYVESLDSSREFEEFLIEAWDRKLQGLEPTNWINGRWQ